MKFMLSVFVLWSSVVSANQIVKKDEPYLFVHCVPTQATDSQSVAHYVFDMRNDVEHKLYVTSGLKSTKATELVDLSLIDRNVDTEITEDNIDVQWTSAHNELLFKLVILSNDGELMEGSVTHRHVEVPIKCLDVHYEN